MSSIISIRPLGFPWQTQDPFLFCAYHRDEYPNGEENLGPHPELLKGRNIGQDFTIKDGWRMYHGSTIPGFPYHPHRGFETITIAKEGLVDHSDSLGAAGRFGAGDVQWMTAGKGVQHSEMFPLLNKDKGNTLEIFQVWLNLPRASKMVEPHFKMLWREEVPIYEHKDPEAKLSKVQVIAGSINGIMALKSTPDSWAAKAENHVAVWTIEMEAGATFNLPPVDSGGINRTIYFYAGDELEVDGKSVSVNHSIDLKSDQTTSLKANGSPVKILFLQGKPISEPVAQYGPFVMNTQEEIQEAFAEYRQTQFGGWPWPEHDQTHGKKVGRFAKHANGMEETK